MVPASKGRRSRRGWSSPRERLPSSDREEVPMREGPFKLFLGHAWQHPMQDYRDLKDLLVRSGISREIVSVNEADEGQDPDDPYDEAYTFMPRIDSEIRGAECVVVHAMMYDVDAAGG
jgi:hypothetical protein